MVVAEVGEAEEVFEPAVDGLGGAVAGERVIEVPQAAFEGAGQYPQLTGRVCVQCFRPDSTC